MGVCSGAVVFTAAALLKIFRVRDPSVELAAWTAALFGSLLIPTLTIALPAVSLPSMPMHQTISVGRPPLRNLTFPPKIVEVPEPSAPLHHLSRSSVNRLTGPGCFLALYCSRGCQAVTASDHWSDFSAKELIRRSRPTGLLPALEDRGSTNRFKLTVLCRAWPVPPVGGASAGLAPVGRGHATGCPGPRAIARSTARSRRAIVFRHSSRGALVQPDELVDAQQDRSFGRRGQ